MICFSNNSSHQSFKEAVDEAIKSSLPLFICPSTVIELSETILLKNNSSILTIIGVNCSQDKRPIIKSSGHSIFQIEGRHAKLVLENLNLLHVCSAEDHRDVGAVLFALNLSSLHIRSCDIHSTHGFGIWCVQKSFVDVYDSKIHSSRRSGCVVFGQSQLTLTNCIICDCAIHNLCTRGNTIVSLKSCRLENAKIRSIYAYQSTDVTIDDCTIMGTESENHAAIEVWYAPSDSTTFSKRHPDYKGTREHCYKDGQGTKKHTVRPTKLTLINSRIHDNNGIGVLIKHDSNSNSNSQVQYTIDNCIIHNNRVGDIIFQPPENLITSREIKTSTSLYQEEFTNGTDNPHISYSTKCMDKVNIEENRNISNEVVVWEYERDDPKNFLSENTIQNHSNKHVWTAIDNNSTQIVEESFQKYMTLQTSTPSSSSTTSGDVMDQEISPIRLTYLSRTNNQFYDIDFYSMTQTNCKTFYSRRIRRRTFSEVEISVKGISEFHASTTDSKLVMKI